MIPLSPGVGIVGHELDFSENSLNYYECAWINMNVHCIIDSYTKIENFLKS